MVGRVDVPERGAPGGLARARVAVTRGGDADEPLRTALTEAGASVVSWPTLAFTGPANPRPLLEALRRLDDFDWIVFTSARGVEPVVARVAAPAGRPRVAAVGPATAGALAEAGWSVDVVGGGKGAAGLVRELADGGRMRGARVLFPAGSLARTTLEAGLLAEGARVHRVEAYQTEIVPPESTLVRRDLAGGVDVVVFASPSAVRGLRASVAGGLAGALRGCSVVVVGETTAQAAREAGLEDVEVARSATVEGLVAACRRVTRSRGGA